MMWSGTYQSSFWLDQWPILAIHFVIQSTGITQVVASAITSPQWRGGGATVHTFASLYRMIQMGGIWWKKMGGVNNLIKAI